MLQNTLSSLLVSLASRYADLSPADVGIGIGGGRLVIDDVKLRADVFNSAALPFRVQEGRAGRLRINVPWSALSHAPVEVYLENVRLIAAPKQSPPDHTTSTPASPYVAPPPPPPIQVENFVEEAAKKGDWHQTIVGRLLFNASVELYGLKVEYRDSDCVGIISVASLRAFSAGSDWQSRFVSLNADSDVRREGSTSAVPMRKLVKLAGLHWVMIPKKPTAATEEYSHNSHLDRESFESKSPIVDGIAVTLRILLCTGTAYTDAQPDILTPGLHTEIDIDVEDPAVNLTSRQIKWIDRLVQQGFGLKRKLAATSDHNVLVPSTSPSLNTKRRPRPVYPDPLQTSPRSTNGISSRPYGDSTTDPVRQSVSYPGAKPGRLAPPPSDTDSYYSTPNLAPEGHDFYTDEQVDAEIEEVSDYDRDEHHDEEEIEDEFMQKPAQGGLRSFWRAIVSENGDETVDDAAIALGLVDGDISEEEVDDKYEEPEEQSADYQYARDVVQAAANAGGLTMKLRVKTPDTAAWDLVDSLREELKRERGVRRRLENLEHVLEEAEKRVRESEEDARALQERNTSLVQEVEDLEAMTSQAGKNKDAMIRQMEAALSNAERKLQSIYQAQFGNKQVQRKPAVVSPQLQHSSPPPPPPPQIMIDSEDMTPAEPPNVDRDVSEYPARNTGEILKAQEDQEEVGTDVDTEVEGKSSIRSTDEWENGDGFVEEPREETIVDVNAREKAPEPKQVVINIPKEDGERTLAHADEMAKIFIEPTREEYFSKVNTSQHFVEDMSSGLTLI